MPILVRNMNKEQLREKVERIKAEKLAREKAELEKSSRIFRGRLGKIIKIGALLSLILSSLYTIDRNLEPSFEEVEIYEEMWETHDVISHDGWHIPATYYHVYLNEDNSYEIFIYMYDYLLAKASNKLEMGYSPIFGIPMQYRAEYKGAKVQKGFEINYGLTVIMPIVIIVFSLIFLLVPFHISPQAVTIGYVGMVFTPIMLIGISIMCLAGINKEGQYEMNMQQLEFHSVEENNALMDDIGMKPPTL